MIDDIVTLLRADGALTTLLTGGIYNAEEVVEISRQNTAGAFDDNDEILPAAIVREESTVPENSLWASANLYFVVFFYQRFGYLIIKQARKRVFQLLDRTRFTPLDPTEHVFQVNHMGDLAGMEDPNVVASLEQSRYQVAMLRITL